MLRSELAELAVKVRDRDFCTVSELAELAVKFRGRDFCTVCELVELAVKFRAGPKYFCMSLRCKI